MTTKTLHAPGEGFAAFGHRVPSGRRANALAHLRQMAPDVTLADAMTMIDQVSQYVERDDPYAALWYMTEAPSPTHVSTPDEAMVRPDARPPFHLDVTGGYRLLAVLCTGGLA